MQIDNMKLYLTIGAVVVVATGALFLILYRPPQDLETAEPTPELPIAGSITQTNTGIKPQSSSGTPATIASRSLITQSGETVTVNDFIRNGETVPDAVNPGSYILAGSLGYCLSDGSCPTGAKSDSFNVSYNEKTHFFNVILLTEPLGTGRLEAEQFIMARLGISEQQACSLNYYVGTPYWVNEAYAGKNLGFSFCPGATALPK